MACDSITIKTEPVEEGPAPVNLVIEPEFVSIKLEPQNEDFPTEEPLSPQASVKVEGGYMKESPAPSPTPLSGGAGGGVGAVEEGGEGVQPEMVEVYIDFHNRVDDGDMGGEPSTSAGEAGFPAPPPDRPHGCATCGKWFRSASNLYQHSRVHSDKRFHCAVCARAFTVRANLRRHVDRGGCKPPEGPFVCDVCDKVLYQHAHKRFHCSVLRRHVDRGGCKPPEGPFVCDVCDKVFERAHLLRSHATRHSTLRPHSCPAPACGARFKHASTLARHATLHSGARPHPCPTCGKTFTHLGLLKPHMRKHTGERPYECPICLKKFSHKHNMQRHQLRHDRVKHLVCHVCHKQFPKESRLKYHMRRHAADNRPFKCERCSKSFSHRQNIQRHYRRKHPQHEYLRPDTDASVAAEIWSKLRDTLDAVPDCILPDMK